MGPRPPKPGARTLAAQDGQQTPAKRGRAPHTRAGPPKPPPAVVKPLVVERRALAKCVKPEPELATDTIVLPAHVVAAIHAVSRELRDLPRDCIRDGHLLVRWLTERGRELDAVARSRIALPAPRPAPALPRPPTPTPTPIARAVACEARVPTVMPRHRDRRGAWRRRLVELGQLVLPL